MEILWNYTGAVTSTDATAVVKVGYDYGAPIIAPKVYSITYDGTTVEIYVNGELIQSTTKASAGLSTFPILYLGADYDDTCWFKGILPEFIMFNNKLNAVERVSMENYLADKWLPAGTQMSGGYITQNTAGTRPSQTSAKAFLEFNELGLTKSGGRVTGWNDNTALGTNRQLTIKSGTTLGIRNIKGKDAVYFDNKTFATLPIMAGADNNPDFITIMFVAQFDDFDNSAYVDGDRAETILSSTSNTIFRIKKFDDEHLISVKIQDWDGINYWIDIPKNKVVTTDIPLLDLGDIQLHLGTSTNNLLPYGDPITVNNHSMLGVGKIPITGLTNGTTYHGAIALNGVIDETTRFKFKTLPSGSKSFKVIVGSCNETGSTAVTWDKMISENADLFIHMGDLNYLDLGTQEKQVFASGLDQSMSPEIKRMLRTVGFEYRYDNHDSLGPTLDRTSDGWVNFLEFFKTAHAYQANSPVDIINQGLYNTFQIGRVKCINLETRRNRDPQATPSNPAKTMLGVTQKQWLKDQLLEAKNNPDTGAIMILTSVLWTSDRNDPNGDSLMAWNAGWSSYAEERAEIANFIYNNQIKNVFIVCADVHMQAIDDGRNSCYITDINGNRVDPNTIDKAYWTPMLEASPFDKYLDKEGGPFNISDLEGSGGGIVGSFEQSYGVVEVLDKGENWLQVKLYTMGYTRDSEWVRNRYYTFNFKTDNGVEGVPPPFDYGIPTEVNMNGYVRKNDDWKKINQRYVRVNNAWKTEILKLKFINGLWKKVYDHNTISGLDPITLSHLSGWGVEHENFIEIHGNGFRDVTYPDNYGGYFELSSNTGDLFGNFPFGTTTGVVNYGVVEAIKCVTFQSDSYISLPSGLGSGIFFNILTDRDFFLGVWIYVNSSTQVGTNSILSDVTSTYGIFTDVIGGVVSIRLNFGPDAIVTAPLVNGWNKIGLNIKGSLPDYNFLFVNDAVFNLNTFAVQDFGDVEVTPVPMYLGSTGTATIANFHYMPKYNQTTQVKRYFEKPPTNIYLRNTANNIETMIDVGWVTGGTNKKISFTVPPTINEGNYEVLVKSLNYVSNPLPIKISSPTTRTTPFETTFNNPEEFKDNFYILHRAWGGANGGVVTENVFIRDGELILRGHGDLYTGDIQGINRDGDTKFHTHPDDPKLGQPWTNRVGGCAVFKEKTGYGSYEIEAFIPNNLGVCYAMWTFFYNEIYPNDPRWGDFIADGLHQQGTQEDGFYITRNHEIDIELPSHLDGGVYSQPSLSNMKCNTWRGELQNWDVPPTDPAYWEEYRDNLTPIGFNIADGNYHKLRFDWHNDRVEFYIDGVLKRINTNTPKGNTIPNIPGHFTFGLWFPSSPMISKPWLVRPERAWAGGVIDPIDGGMKADFDVVEMKVKKFTFTPFNEPGENVTGETYPFGGYRIKNDNNV